MQTTTPDIFTYVHKGIRRALFAACTALGRAGDDSPQESAARALLRDVLRFVAHHGENEDMLLFPLLQQRAPKEHDRISEAHHRLNASLDVLVPLVSDAPIHQLYLRASDFIALYLHHMVEEEQDLEPVIRRHLSADEIASFGRGSVERTAPADQIMMLGWMLPAMTPLEGEALLSRLPPPLQLTLRARLQASSSSSDS